MRIIAIAMTKGGVGKTTTAVNLAHGLTLRGQRVLLVDTDTQGQCSKALGVECDLTLSEVLTGVVSIFEALTRARPNLDLVGSNHRLCAAALEIARRETDGHLALAEALAPVRDRYDTIVLDASPGIDAIAVNVLGCASEIIAPVALSPAAMASVLDFVRHVDRVARHNRQLRLRYLLPTFLDLRNRQSGEMLAQLHDHFHDEICPPIRVNVKLSESFGWRQSIFEYAPQSRGAEDYDALCDLVAKGVPERVTMG